jgi:hypothetical protein
MTLCRSLLPALAIAVAALSSAAAQFGPSQPPCWNDFVPLREEVQKRAQAVYTAQKRKAPVAEACQLIGRFVEAEAKMVKFAQDNEKWCIPPEAVKQMKDGHEKATELRKRVCAAAAAGAQPRPAGPTLSDALGTTRVPDASKPRTGTGTFDTLTGSIPTR